MPSAKRVLVVDDHAVNCRMLSNILAVDYKVAVAEDGRKALKILENQEEPIDAVLLDLMMPVMDGYQFLEAVKEYEVLKNVPIIVVTGSGDRESERKALKMGAWDFVTKPYDPEIIRFRLKNALDRSQLTAFYQLKYLAEYDQLTDIYNEATFYEATRRMLREKRNVSFLMVYFDIDRFSLVNSIFGTEEGNRILCYIANGMKKISETCDMITYGRIDADKFAFCVPEQGEGVIPEQAKEILQQLKEYQLNYDLVPSMGIYSIVDREISIDKMLDCARLASKGAKGNYIDNVVFYRDSMQKEIEKEQEIINDMNPALEKHQFLAYIQPKRELASGKIIGGEALVRWKHPDKGLISPNDFVPLFEKNGFIAKLDYYIWETVCGYLRTWLDEGCDPNPISVNVSRVNMYNPHLVEDICELTDKYQIPHRLLNLEVTESACAENLQVLQKIIHRFREKGFLVMMDDFGSAYSSLNSLKNIEVDVLKIDMEFLSKSRIPGRGEDIIASVVCMAKTLGIITIAEGVENEKQEEFLRELGCEYAQGYYVSPPIPKEEYEQLVM